MIRYFREMLRSVQGLATALQDLSEALAGVHVGSEGSEALGDRLDGLERRQATWEGEVEAMITRAESRFGAARASEERTRHMARRVHAEDEEDAEGGAEGVDEQIEAYVRAMAERNGQGGGAQGVQPVRSSLESRAEIREALRAHKLGR